MGKNPHVRIGVRIVTSKNLLPGPERPGSSFQNQLVCLNQQVPRFSGLQSCRLSLTSGSCGCFQASSNAFPPPSGPAADIYPALYSLPWLIQRVPWSLLIKPSVASFSLVLNQSVTFPSKGLQVENTSTKLGRQGREEGTAPSQLPLPFLMPW